MAPGCQWRNGLAEATVKLLKSTLMLTLSSQTTLNYAELDTMFSTVADIVNRRPIAVKSFTDDDLHAITPNDLLLQRTRNSVPGAVYDASESLTHRQEVMRELEDTWWSQWLVQAFPHLVPYKKWKSDHRNLQPNDIVHVLYDRKVSKGTYRLGRVLSVQEDAHGVVRTVTVGLRRQDRRETALPYVPKALEEVTLGVQRVCVVLPVEEQIGDLGIVGTETGVRETVGDEHVADGTTETVDAEELVGYGTAGDDAVRH